MGAPGVSVASPGSRRAGLSKDSGSPGIPSCVSPETGKVNRREKIYNADKTRRDISKDFIVFILNQ
jgi:hypothetical protein